MKPPIIIEERGKFVYQKSLFISDLKIDYLDLENSVRNNERGIFDQSRCSHYEVSHRNEKFYEQQKKVKVYKISPLNSQILITSIMKVTTGNQIRASDVDQRIISLQFVFKLDTSEKKITGTRKILKLLKLVHIYQQKYISHRKTVQTKSINRRYTCL